MPIAGRIRAGEWPAPYWSGGGASLYHGHVLDRLRGFPARSVHCVVTSPPYWGLRDYGTGAWEGGDPTCDHRESSPSRTAASTRSSGLEGGKENIHQSHVYRGDCGRCGARRTDSQIGLEPSPDCGTHGQAQCGGCFACSMVGVFREVRRVLRDDGTCWLNLGDSYNSSGGKGGAGKQHTNRGDKPDNREGCPALAQGNLIGVPWRVALALQADGWVLRQALPWVKSNAMPESCETRPGKAVEDVFLLVKGDSYYFDIDAVRPDTRSYRSCDLWYSSTDNSGIVGVGDDPVGIDLPVATHKGCHYATFSPRMVEPLIRMGSSDHGCCAACARPWERVVVKSGSAGEAGGAYAPPGQAPHSNAHDRSFDWSRNGLPSSGSPLDGSIPQRRTVGWRQTCGCAADQVAPCVVLDPFVGSGTTVATALRLGRRGVGIDLSEEYLLCDAIPRIKAAVAGGPVAEPTAAVPTASVPPVRRLRGCGDKSP